MAVLFPYSVELMVFIAAVFLFAGLVKGVLGMGLPAILMVNLTLFIPPVEAIRIIVLPMLFLNIFQFSRGPNPKATAKQFALLALVTCSFIAIMAVNILSFPEDILLLSIGIAMLIFAIPSLFGWRFLISAHPIWQLLAGATAGVIGGLSAVWSPPLVMYLMGRQLDKDQFIGAAGWLFMTGSLTLVISFGLINQLDSSIIVPSLGGLILAMIGFRLGETLRHRINGEMFRKLVLIAFLIMGCRLMLISLF